MTLAANAARDDALRRIQEIVGDRGWTTDPAEMAPYLDEQRGLYRGRCAMVVRPADTGEVAGVVRLCAEAGIGIVPQGGNTGLVGAAVPREGQILISLGRMNRVREVDALNDTITVEAGCILANVQAAAAEADRLFPLSLGAEGTCQIGGNLATNAGGVNVLRYGNMRDLVLGLEVVLPDGRVWNGLRRLRKDNTGYDLKHVFIGAEGTLGIITAAVLKLFPRPRERETALVAVRDLPGVIELLARARAASGDAVTAFEYVARIGVELAVKHLEEASDPLDAPHEHYVLIELSSPRPDARLREALESILEGAFESGLVEDGVIAESGPQADQLWHLREALPEAQTREGGSIKFDVSVPVSRVPEFITEASARVREALPGIRPVPFGHVGDGNIHFNLSQPAGADRDAFLAEWERMNRVVHDLVVSMDGSISAEHGIGLLKRDELTRYKPPVEVELMRRLKAALDPRGIMNPGKIL